MDELPSTSTFLPQNVYYDPTNNRSYTIRLRNGRINPNAAARMAARFATTGAQRAYINNTFLQPNGLRIIGNRVYDITTTRGSNTFRRDINRQRAALRAQQIAERNARQLRNAQTRAILPIQRLYRRQANIPVFNRSRIDRINARTRIFRFVYSFNTRGDWVSQVRDALSKSAYLENQPNLITRTQIMISALPARASIDAHLANNNLRTTYSATMNDALLNIIARKRAAEDEYDMDDIDFDTIIINKILTPVGGQGGGRSENSANKTWLALDKKAKTNCFYNSVCAIKLFTKKNNEGGAQYEDRVRNYLNNIEDTRKQIGNNAKVLKRSWGHNITNLVDLDMMKDYVERVYNITNQRSVYIQLYNNIFEKTRLIIPDAVKTEIDNDINNKDKILSKLKRYEIQLMNNHYIPLIRWRELGLQPPEAPPPALSAEEDADYIIQKYNNKKNKETDEWEKIVIPFDDRIAAYDLEATPNGVANGDFTTFCASFVFRNRTTNEAIRKSWYGLDACKQFVDWLSANMDSFSGYTIYAHNNGKFDMIQMFKDYVLTDTTCPLKIDPDKLIPLNGAYIGVSLYNDEGSINFKDSLKMLPAPLAKLGKEFNVEHQKLDSVVLPDGREVSIDHDQVNIDNWDTYDIRHSQQEYCEWDSLCLLEVLETFSKDVYAATGLNITDCFTGASLSKKHYYKNFYQRFKTPIYHLSNDNDKYIRNSYYGGRNEAFYIGKYDHKVYYYDFTSLYPSEGRHRLPFGSPTKVNQEIIDICNETEGATISTLPFGFYRVRVKTIDQERIPLHAIKNNGRLTFPIFENWTELTIFSEEMKLGYRNNQYEYQIIDGISFKNKKFMADFFEDGFNKKGKAKAEGKPALAQVYKIIINSGYGFFGLNTLGKEGKGRDGVDIYPKDTMDFWDVLNADGLVNIGTMGNYNVVRSNKQLEITDFNVGVASAITSWARIRIWSFVDDMSKKGAEILYMDTDSAIINKSIKSYPDIMREYCWDGTGDELGSMKNECDDEVKDYFAKKVKQENPTWSKAQIKAETKIRFDRQVAIDNGDLYFDNFIGGGCKQYALIKKLYDDGIVEICKMKGYSKRGLKLHFEDFEKLTLAYYKQKEIEGKYEKKCKRMIEEIKAATDELIITQDQTQFRTPLSYHLVDIRVEKWVVPKDFRIGYTKGVVQPNGYIIPLRL